jgi:hypothetical protein
VFIRFRSICGLKIRATQRCRADDQRRNVPTLDFPWRLTRQNALAPITGHFIKDEVDEDRRGPTWPPANAGIVATTSTTIKTPIFNIVCREYAPFPCLRNWEAPLWWDHTQVSLFAMPSRRQRGISAGPQDQRSAASVEPVGQLARRVLRKLDDLLFDTGKRWLIPAVTRERDST